MKGPKSIYICTECEYKTTKWMGKCPSCGAWNSMEEQEEYLTETAADILTRYGYEEPQKTVAVLTETEQKIVDLLAEVEEMHISELSTRLGIPTFKLTATLASLEVKSVVVKLGGNRYALV